MLALLREIRSDVAHLRADMVEINERLGLVEAQYAHPVVPHRPHRR